MPRLPSPQTTFTTLTTIKHLPFPSSRLPLALKLPLSFSRHASSTTTPSPSPASKLPLYNTPSPMTTSPRPSTSAYPAGPAGETPKEKVARLRAAHRLRMARAAMTPLDRMVAWGRDVADIGHRLTVLFLLGSAGVVLVGALVIISDMLLFVRRQRWAWTESELDRLEEARRAWIRGDADPEQLHLLELEQAGEDMRDLAARDKARRRRESWWGKGLAMVGVQVGAAAGEEGVEGEGLEKGEVRVEPEEAARYGAPEPVREKIELRLEDKVVPLPGMRGDAMQGKREKSGEGKKSWWG